MKLRFLLGILIGLLVYLPVFAHKKTEKSITIKVMSYNIHHANPPGKSDVIDLDAITKTIESSGADIVALQEVDINTKRSNNINQAQELARKLNMNVYFSKAIDFEGGEYGLAILSKFKIADSKNVSLSKAADSTTENRILQSVTVNVAKDVSLIFANTHLEVSNTGNRELQAKEIVEFAKQQQLPIILAGDWNATLKSTTVNVLDTAFQRTCDICPVTCPEDGDNGAIDFIAFTKNSQFKTQKYTVFNDNRSSDHYPILAEIQLK
jgi:endonuclease/exonuclease/phosphatase family metal-dependent hydrolase